jgi:cytochrome b involved in lipid metabolism
MRKIIYIIVGLLVLGAGGFFVYEQKVEKDLNDFVANKDNQVSVASTSVYTMSEVALHANKSDCWMVIENSVYNVTTFVDKHPGGEVILEGCGKDATGYFKGVKEHVKPLVQAILAKLKIGEIKN